MYEEYWRGRERKPNPQYVARLLTVLEMTESISTIDNLLDVACGVGYLTRLLSEKAKCIIAFDISVDAVRRARKRVTTPQYIIADCQYLPFRDDAFDVAVASEIIEHVPYPERMLRELHQVIKKKGCLMISTPNRRRIGQRLMRLFGIVLPMGQHLREYDLNEFVKHIYEASFEIVSLRTDYVGLGLPIAKNVFYLGSRRLAKFFPLLSSCFVIKARK
jgi:ubiquinone/menaquinone biosynthesis C-methylase UbiE